MQKAKKYWKWYTGAGVVILGIIDRVLNWGIPRALWDFLSAIFAFVISEPIVSALILLGSTVIFLWFRIQLIERYFPIRFSEDFRKDLKKNWDFNGKWEIVDSHELHVTDSELGGITKSGQLWTDYKFEFDALIVNDRIGWIVRAQDLFNCYMIQLTPTQIRPHVRVGGLWILLSEPPHHQTIQNGTWVHVCTLVRGLEVRVYINDVEVFQQPDLFSMKFFQVQQGNNLATILPSPQPGTVVIPAATSGRVGFRLCAPEAGRFRRCRVSLLKK